MVQNCDDSFSKLKATEPVLASPAFNLRFKLAVDASEVAAGTVLLQEKKDSVDHPICYFSKKFNKSS